MEVTAKARFQRGSARKVRLLLPPLRGMQADEAMQRLRLAPQAAARPVSKLIASAVANAEHNYSLDKKQLVIDRIAADQGPSYKRYRPAARGRAMTIRRPSYHVTVALKDIPAPGGTPVAADSKKRGTKAVAAAKTAVKKTVAKAAPKRTGAAKPGPEAAKPKDQVQKQSTTKTTKPNAPRKTDRQTGRAKSTQGKGS